MDDRWVKWGKQLAAVRQGAGHASPSAVAWEATTGIDRNKWKRWEGGNKPDYLVEVESLRLLSGG